MRDLILTSFSISGRTSRRAFLRRWLKLCYLSALVMSAGIFLASQGVKFAAYVALAVEALLIAFNLAMHVRRFHDRNRSGWWLLVFLAADTSLYFVEGLQRKHPDIFIFIVLALLIVNLWLLMELFFRRGTRGANRFGEDPSLQV